jgi:hypothetical protein
MLIRFNNDREREVKNRVHDSVEFEVQDRMDAGGPDRDGLRMRRLALAAFNPVDFISAEALGAETLAH